MEATAPCAVEAKAPYAVEATAPIYAAPIHAAPTYARTWTTSFSLSRLSGCASHTRCVMPPTVLPTRPTAIQTYGRRKAAARLWMARRRSKGDTVRRDRAYYLVSEARSLGGVLTCRARAVHACACPLCMQCMRMCAAVHLDGAGEGPTKQYQRRDP